MWEEDAGPACPADSGTDAGDQSAEQVIGDCRIDGRRYLILRGVSEQGPSPERDAAAVHLLTRREIHVAIMVCEGRVNKQIAHELRFSEWTVSSCLRRIYTKLGVRTRAAMVARLMSNSGPQPPVDKPHGVVSERGGRLTEHGRDSLSSITDDSLPRKGTGRTNRGMNTFLSRARLRER